MIQKAIYALLLVLTIALPACEEPRRKTDKQLKRQQYEKQKKAYKGPKETYRVYFSDDRKEKLEGRLVERYSNGIVIERQTDGKYFTILFEDLNPKDALYVRRVEGTHKLAPMPRTVVHRTQEIEKLKDELKDLYERITLSTRDTERRGLATQTKRIEKNIAKLEADIRRFLRGKKFIETPR